MTEQKKDTTVDIQTLMALANTSEAEELLDGDQIFQALQQIQQDPRSLERWLTVLSLERHYRSAEPEFAEEDWEEAGDIANEIVAARLQSSQFSWIQKQVENWKQYFVEERDKVVEGFRIFMDDLPISPRNVSRSLRPGEVSGSLDEKTQSATDRSLESDSLFACLYSPNAPQMPQLSEDGIQCVVKQGEQSEFWVNLPEAGYVAVVCLGEEDENELELFYPVDEGSLSTQSKGLKMLFRGPFEESEELRFLVYFSRVSWSELAGEYGFVEPKGKWWSEDDSDQFLQLLISQTESLELIKLNVSVEA